jgi:site-specific recombinase XerD
LRFFFSATLKRHDLAEEVVSTREPRRLPVVLSPEEVARLLASATNIKHKGLLSLAYATGLRASEVVSLKLRTPASVHAAVSGRHSKTLNDSGHSNPDISRRSRPRIRDDLAQHSGMISLG